MVDVFTILILVFDFAISIWNAYSSGYAIGIIRKNKIEGFTKVAAYSGLGLGFVGITYVMIIALSFIGYSLGYVTANAVLFALSFDFLVFGLLIIGFGLMITIQSIAIAARTRNVWSILVAVFNTFIEIWDIASYVQGFGEATRVLQGESREDRNQGVIIVLIALLIGYFITHAAYKHGLSRAEASAQQAASA